MAYRIDALGARPGRAGAFSGAVLDEAPDEELQRVVDEAAELLDAPIALVSLVLERTQFFRAHHGLPIDLAVAQGTDRDASFCQFVVRDAAPFEVTAASEDARVPQDLVEGYGVQAYLGIPLESGGQVLGSLCVIDVERREFSEEQRRVLGELAQRAQARLRELSAAPADSRLALIDRAMGPAFSEIRNLLATFGPNVAAASVAATELGVLARVAERYQGADVPVAKFLSGAGRALDDLHGCLEDLAECDRRLNRAIHAVEIGARAPTGDCALSEVVESANELARHHSKLVGGVSWEGLTPGLRLHARRPVAVAAISTCITVVAAVLVARKLSSGIHAEVCATDHAAKIRISAPGLPATDLDAAAKPITVLLREEKDADLTVAGAVLELLFTLVSPAAK